MPIRPISLFFTGILLLVPHLADGAEFISGLPTFGDYPKSASVVDADGKAHFFIADSGRDYVVLHVTQDGSETSLEILDANPGVGKGVAADLGPDGVLHVVYSYVEPFEVLFPVTECFGGNQLCRESGWRHAWYDGTEWQYEWLDLPLHVGKTIAMAVDSFGELHFAGVVEIGDSYDFEYRYLEPNGSGWTSTAIPSLAGGNAISQGSIGNDSVLLQLDADDEPALLFLQDNGGTWYSPQLSRRTGSAWRIAAMPGVDDQGAEFDLLVTDDNVAHVVYVGEVASGFNGSRYATESAGTVDVVDMDDGYYSNGAALANTPSGDIKVAYEYVGTSGSSFRIVNLTDDPTAIESEFDASASSFGLTWNGDTPVGITDALFADSTSIGPLTTFQLDAGGLAWQAVLDSGTNANTEDRLMDLRVDADGVWHAAFTSGGGYSYAVRRDGVWEQVVRTGPVYCGGGPRDLDMEVDASGMPHIVAECSGKIFYATLVDGYLVESPLADLEYWEGSWFSPSIALDINGLPVIFTLLSNGDALLLERTASDWATTVLFEGSSTDKTDEGQVLEQTPRGLELLYSIGKHPYRWIIDPMADGGRRLGGDLTIEKRPVSDVNFDSRGFAYVARFLNNGNTMPRYIFLDYVGDDAAGAIELEEFPAGESHVLGAMSTAVSGSGAVLVSYHDLFDRGHHVRKVSGSNVSVVLDDYERGAGKSNAVAVDAQGNLGILKANEYSGVVTFDLLKKAGTKGSFLPEPAPETTGESSTSGLEGGEDSGGGGAFLWLVLLAALRWQLRSAH